LLVEEGERAALYFQRKDFEIVRKIKFAPKPNKPRRLDTLSNVLGDVRVGSRLCENALEPRMRRIVFSIAFFRQKLPVQLVSASTKSRRKFYTRVQRKSFHTA
jgi:hypothetical protein